MFLEADRHIRAPVFHARPHRSVAFCRLSAALAARFASVVIALDDRVAPDLALALLRSCVGYRDTGLPKGFSAFAVARRPGNPPHAGG